MSNNKIAIYVQTYNDFKITFNKLKLNGIEFHTKTPNQEKLHSWLLREVAGDFNKEDIRTELLKANIKNVNFKEIKKILLNQKEVAMPSSLK